MSIDPRTGTVQFEGTHSLGPDLRRQLFLASPLGRGFQQSVTNEPWVSYFGTLNDVTDEFALTAVFYGDQIAEFRLAKTDSIKTHSWADWSEEKELRRKAEHDRLLKQILGQASARFSWGEIASVYDSRSGGSEIIIRYKMMMRALGLLKGGK